MIADRGKQTLLALLGVSAGVATGVALWRRSKAATRTFEGPRGWARPRGSAQDVSAALRSDPKLGRRQIAVDAVAEGVVELSGGVRDRAEAERAIGIAQATTGVYTVVNRLRVEDEEAHRESTRRRWNEGAPDLRERHHYGMGVGMGTRRQSPTTDPDRPSDKQRLVERELDVGSIDDEPDAPTPDLNGGRSRVESEPMKPGDERAIEEAGLAGTMDGAGDATPSREEEGAAGESEDGGSEQRGTS